MNTNQQLTGRTYKAFHQLPSQTKRSKQAQQHNPVEINFRDQKGSYRLRFDMSPHERGRPGGARKA